MALSCCLIVEFCILFDITFFFQADGLEKLRQIIARQRHGKESGGAEKRETEPSNWKNTTYPTNIPPIENAGLHPCSSVAGASGKTLEAIAGPGISLSNDGHSIATRTLHRNDDPIQPSKKTRHEPRTVSIPRKVAQAPAPPSYKGNSVISFVDESFSEALEQPKKIFPYFDGSSC